MGAIFYDSNKDSKHAVVLKTKKIFAQLYRKITKRVDKLQRQIDFNNLMYKYKPGNTLNLASIFFPLNLLLIQKSSLMEQKTK